MAVQTALQLLEQAALEAYLMSPVEFVQCTDRVHQMFDASRNKLSPVEERRAAPALHTQAVAVQGAAICELAQTFSPTANPVAEELAYVYLAKLGQTIRQPQLVDILQQTVVRLRKPAAVLAAAE